MLRTTMRQRQCCTGRITSTGIESIRSKSKVHVELQRVKHREKAEEDGRKVRHRIKKEPELRDFVSFAAKSKTCCA